VGWTIAELSDRGVRRAGTDRPPRPAV